MQRLLHDANKLLDFAHFNEVPDGAATHTNCSGVGQTESEERARERESVGQGRAGLAWGECAKFKTCRN